MNRQMLIRNAKKLMLVVAIIILVATLVCGALIKHEEENEQEQAPTMSVKVLGISDYSESNDEKIAGLTQENPKEGKVTTKTQVTGKETVKSFAKAEVNGKIYINSTNTVVLQLDGTDESRYKANTLTEDSITVKVGGTVVNPTTKKLSTATEIANGVRYELTLSGIPGNGELSVVVNANTLEDEATNKNVETTQVLTTFDKKIIIDNTKPTISVTPDKCEVHKTLDVTVNVSDEGGSELLGANEYLYQLGNSATQVPTENWKNYINGTKFNIGDKLTGTYYLWIKEVKDGVGNISEKNGSKQTSYHVFGPYIFDNTAPVITANDITYGETLSINLHDYDSKVKSWNLTQSNTSPKDGWTEISPEVANTTVQKAGLSAGEYYIWARDIFGNESSKKITVKQKDVKNFTVTLDPTSYVYDGSDKKPTETVKDGDKVLKKGTDYTVDYSNNKNVGTANVIIKGIGNYTGTKTENFTITKRTLTVTADEITKVYGDEIPELTYKHSGEVAGETPEFTGKLETKATKTSNVGQYDITQGTLNIVDKGNFLVDNYTLKFVSSKLIIVRAEGNVTVKITGTNTFGQTLTATPTTLSDGVKTYQWWTATQANATSGSNITNATGSTYTIGKGNVGKYIGCTVTVAQGTNYKACSGSDITDAATNTTATVEKKKLIKPTISGTYTYNTKEQTVTLNNYDENTMTVTNNKRTNAGSQTVTVKLKDTANYAWSDGSVADVTLTWTIAKAASTVTLKITGTNTFGQKLTATPTTVADGNKTYQWWTATQATATSGTNITNATGSTYTVGAGLVGKYIGCTVTIADGTNYKGCNGSDITDAATNTTATVEKKKLTKPTISGSYTYNKKEQTVTLNNYDENTMTVTNNKRTNAGSQTVTVKLKDTANYAWSDGSVADVTLTWTIAKAASTVTLKITGTNTFGQKLTATPTTVADGNKTYQWWTATQATATSGTNIANATGSTYTIGTGNVGKYIGCTVTVAAGTNYNGCNGSDITDAATNTTATVEKKKLTKPTISGSYTYNTKEQTVTLSNYDANTMTVTNNKRTNAGSQTVTVKLKDTANYEWSDGSVADVSLTWTIAKATTTVTLKITGTNTFGQTLTATPTTVADGAKTYQWWTATQATATSGTNITNATGSTYTIGSGNVGKYIGCTVTVAAGTNYNGCNGSDITDSSNGTVTVAKKNIAAPSANTGLTYNGSTQTGVATGTGYSLSGTSSAIDASSYTATATLSDTTNTQWSDGTTAAKSIYWSISTKSISVTWSTTTSFTYTGSNQAPTVTSPVNGVGSEKVYITRTTYSSIGSHTSTASISSVSGGRGRTGNYTLTNTTKTFTITTSPTASASLTSGSKTYNGSTQYATTSGSHVTWSGTTSAINAGSYTAYATPSTGYSWSDGTTSRKTFTWSISKKSVSVTWSSGTYTYNGSSQGPTASASSGVNGETLNLTVSGKGTNAGNYTATASLSSVTGGQSSTSNYTLTNTSKSFSIAKANGYVNLSSSSGTIPQETASITITIKNHHGGNLSATTTDGSVTVNGLNVTVSDLASVEGGTIVTITVKCAANTNYTEATATYKLKIERGVSYSKLKIGDYVSNYPYDYQFTSGATSFHVGYRGAITNRNTYNTKVNDYPKWRIISIDEKNEIVKLVSSSIVSINSSNVLNITEDYKNEFTDTYTEGDVGNPKVRTLITGDVENVVGHKIRNIRINFQL